MKQAGRTLVVFEINSGGRSAISFFHNHGFKETDGWNLAAAGAIAIFQVLDSHAPPPQEQESNCLHVHPNYTFFTNTDNHKHLFSLNSAFCPINIVVGERIFSPWERWHDIIYCNLPRAG